MSVLPRWALDPFDNCVTFISDDVHTLDLSLRGLSQAAGRPRYLKAHYARLNADVRDALTPEQEAELSEAAIDAEFVDAEQAAGFPVLHGHAAVSLWAALDALAMDVSIAWLENARPVVEHDEVAKIKIPLAEYHGLTDRERFEFLVSALANRLNANLKVGIGKFEAILEAIGLGGTVDPDLRKTLLELSQVRNLLVHRAGLVDRRFSEVCPWLGATAGEKWRVDSATYHRYFRAVMSYVKVLRARVEAACRGMQLTEDGPAPRGT